MLLSFILCDPPFDWVSWKYGILSISSSCDLRMTQNIRKWYNNLSLIFFWSFTIFGVRLAFQMSQKKDILDLFPRIIRLCLLCKRLQIATKLLMDLLWGVKTPIGLCNSDFDPIFLSEHPSQVYCHYALLGFKCLQSTLKSVKTASKGFEQIC